MKLSIALSVLLSVPAIGYAPTSNFRPIQQPASSTGTLGYTEAAIDVEKPDINWLLHDDPATAKLKEALGFTETAIMDEYTNWVKQYRKVPEESRYVTYKKNFLMQEEYNQKVGASFTLNEYGDMTEEEFRQMRAGVASFVPPKVDEEPVAVSKPEVVEEETISLEKPLDEKKEDEKEDSVTLENPVNEKDEKPKVEISDEAEIVVEKYKAIDNAEERAFTVLKDLNIVKAAPQHFSYSYVDTVPELKLEAGSNYLGALHNPDVSSLAGSSTPSSYISSIPSSQSGTFKEKKNGSKLGASDHYLDDICEAMEPFIDCNKGLSPDRFQSPVEKFAHKRAAQIKALGDKAFQVLLDLCSIGKCQRK